MACSRVCPFFEIPASNSPTPPATISTAQSAWEVPVIMFLMKSRCPGASMMVPRSRSALSLSKTQAYLKEPLPISWASFSNFDGTLVDTSAFVDQMTGGGGFARVDVANNDDVNMCLFLAHGGLLLLGRI